MYRLYRAQVLVSFAIFGATVPLVIAASLGDRDGPTLLFVLAWIAVLCWNAYWFLLRLCYRVDLQDGILRWRAPLRSGNAPLVGLRALRPGRLSPNIAVFEFVDGPRVLVLARRGLADFAARVQAAAPQAVVRTSWYTRLTERLPGSTGFRSGDGM
jgi:hypothetical protein